MSQLGARLLHGRCVLGTCFGNAVQGVGYLGDGGSSSFNERSCLYLGTTARAGVGLGNLAPDFGAVLVKCIKSTMVQPTPSVGGC